MELKISDRVTECQTAIKDANDELVDYQTLVMLIRAVQAVIEHPEKYQYDPADYKKVIDQIDRLCQKHELRVPPSTNWASVEIV
jgi:hypothetical protein